MNTYHQWYPLRMLTDDIRTILRHNAAFHADVHLAADASTTPSEKEQEGQERSQEGHTSGLVEIVNLFPEPLLTQTIVRTFFPDQEDVCYFSDGEAFVDDVRTQHSGLWPESQRGGQLAHPGGSGGYRLDVGTELAEIARFLQEGAGGLGRE